MLSGSNIGSLSAHLFRVQAIPSSNQQAVSLSYRPVRQIVEVVNPAPEKCVKVDQGAIDQLVERVARVVTRTVS